MHKERRVDLDNTGDGVRNMDKKFVSPELRRVAQHAVREDDQYS